MKVQKTVAALCLSMAGSTLRAEVDEATALDLLKKSDCFKCHSINKKKDGPPYNEVAKKYKGKADAEEKLFKHVTTNPIVEIDGKKEEHRSLKTKDEAEIKNLVRFVLSRS